MKTIDLFKISRSAQRLNESLQKTFGKKINLEDFDLHQLQDARNKLRTQISQVRSQSGFNENIENEAITQAQWMLDAINAEIAHREEFVIDSLEQEAEESIEEKAPPGDKAERMVKHIKKGYAKDGKLTDKEKSIAYATAWKQHNKEKNESTESGEDMTTLREGEVQQASAIVTAKTMVDRVSRWIEELSGMENDTLLQLGDSIRDEMGQEQAKAFLSAVAPAIQQALENLKTTRDTLSGSVRSLASGEQPADMLGGEPGEEEMTPASPDEMNMPAEEPAAPEGGDEFAAAEPAAGVGDQGREQRESINYQNRLLKVLAG
jgi:hypothetical protein